MTETTTSEEWRKILTEGHRPLTIARHAFRHIPSAPRCKVCANPFGGVGGKLLGVAGWKRSRKNPNVCSKCCDTLPAGGADVDVAVLFADVRGSTTLGERTDASAYAELLNRFYKVGTEVLLRHDGLIDKMIGDELMALFIPGVTGPDYRRRAVSAGLDMLHAVGYGSPEGPWLEVGAAVNAGIAYVGNVGSAVVDFTALGDPVNVAARLQGRAAGGELVVAHDVCDDLTDLLPGARAETMQVKGRDEPVEALVASAA
jgi:adenylate cyclase